MHDRAYKKLFSHPRFFQQLVETFVPEEFIKEYDFSRIEKLDKSFVSRHFQQRESDLIYKVKHGESDGYVIIFIEFQSRSDRTMSLRMLNYISSFYLDLVQSSGLLKKARQLPAVLPIVLYNGRQKWTSPTEFSDLVEQSAFTKQYGIKFRYHCIAENTFSHEKLLKISNLVSTLFLAENGYSMEAMPDVLLDLYDREPDKEGISLLINWFVHAYGHGRISESELKNLERVYYMKRAVTTGMKEAKDAWGKQYVIKGEAKARMEIALAMLKRDMEPVAVAEMTGLSQKVIKRMKKELESES